MRALNWPGEGCSRPSGPNHSRPAAQATTIAAAQ